MSQSVVSGPIRLLGKIERFAYEVFQWTVGDINLVFSSRQPELYPLEVFQSWMGVIRLKLQYQSDTWNLWVMANINQTYYLRFPVIVTLLNCKVAEVHIVYISTSVPNLEIKQFVYKGMLSQPTQYDFQKPLTIKVEVKPALANIFDVSPDLELKCFVGSPVYSDVRLYVEDDTLYAHRVILSAASSYFAENFELLKLSPTETSTVTFKGITTKAVKELLRFMYTGKIENIGEHKENLLLASVKFNLPRLKKECANYLYYTMNDENVSEYLNLAKKYEIETVQNLASKFANSNDGLQMRKRPKLDNPLNLSVPDSTTNHQS